MLTYQMNFHTIIESVDTKAKQMVVEYLDPHGGDSLRIAIAFSFDATADDLKQLAIDNTPHKYFHDRNEEKKAIIAQKIDYTSLDALVGQHMNYELPSFDNEVI
jgi:hypothetical protein